MGIASVIFIWIILDVSLVKCSYPKSQCQEGDDLAQVYTSVQSQIFDVVPTF